MIFAFFQNIVMAILRANPLRIENKGHRFMYKEGFKHPKPLVQGTYCWFMLFQFAARQFFNYVWAANNYSD